MADGDDSEFSGDTGDHSPDSEGDAAGAHGYDAVFFIVAAVVAIGFVVALYYFRG